MTTQYNNSMINSGDPISQLPVDNTPVNESENQILDTIFGKHRKTIDVIINDSKDAILVSIIFMIFSLDQVDGFIKKFLPIIGDSEYILLLVKGLMAGFVFWIVKYFYLSRKSS